MAQVVNERLNQVPHPPTNTFSAVQINNGGRIEPTSISPAISYIRCPGDICGRQCEPLAENVWRYWLIVPAVVCYIGTTDRQQKVLPEVQMV